MTSSARQESSNRYAQIISRIFELHYQPGEKEFLFARSDLALAAEELGVKLPKNLGDIIYSFRYRVELPEEMRSALPAGMTSWLIWPAGSGQYRFVAKDREISIAPNPALPEIKIANSTPGLITRYALSDEQALLAEIGYCRLIDVFTGVTCYRLQSHLRTQVEGMGQVETDDVYVGVDKRGSHYVFPVQAKGRKDWLSIVQVAQDLAMARNKFPGMLCRSISAQFRPNGSIALFSHEESRGGILPELIAERHYRLVPQEEVTVDELKAYSERPLEPTV